MKNKITYVFVFTMIAFQSFAQPKAVEYKDGSQFKRTFYCTGTTVEGQTRCFNPSPLVRESFRVPLLKELH